MKSKVTVKELVGTKMVYALLLVFYYWMWARQDWHDYYNQIQQGVILFTILFFAMQASRLYRYGKQAKDELAIQNLRRVDAVGLKIMVAAAIIIAFASAVTFIDGRMAGYALVGTVLALTVIRYILFCVVNGKAS